MDARFTQLGNHFFYPYNIVGDKSSLVALQNDFRFHVMNHTGERPSQCSLCDYACTSDTVLHNHVKFRHKVEENLCSFKI